MSDSLELVHVPPQQALEAEILSKLRSGVAPSVAIPWDMPTAEVLRWILACGSLLARADRMGAVVKPALGRLMVMARKGPEVLIAAQCRTLGEFEKYLTEQTGYGHTSLHHCQQVYEWAGDMPLSQYESCGWANVLLLARHSKGASENQKRELIQAAETRTTDQLKTWLDENGHVPKGATTGATLVLTGSLEDVQELREWLKRLDVQAAAGTSDELGILLAAKAEASTEWLQG